MGVKYQFIKIPELLCNLLEQNKREVFLWLCITVNISMKGNSVRRICSMMKANILEDNEMQIASCNNTYRPNSFFFISPKIGVFLCINNNNFHFLNSLKTSVTKCLFFSEEKLKQKEIWYTELLSRPDTHHHTTDFLSFFLSSEVRWLLHTVQFSGIKYWPFGWGSSLNSDISFQTKLNSQEIILVKVFPNTLFHFCPEH